MSRSSENTAPLNFPVSVKLKARISDYARSEKLTLAAACRVLLEDALSRLDREDRSSGLTEGEPASLWLPFVASLDRP
jgi:hypothetical protein